MADPKQLHSDEQKSFIERFGRLPNDSETKYTGMFHELKLSGVPDDGKSLFHAVAISLEKVGILDPTTFNMSMHYVPEDNESIGIRSPRMGRPYTADSLIAALRTYITSEIPSFTYIN